MFPSIPLLLLGTWHLALLGHAEGQSNTLPTFLDSGRGEGQPKLLPFHGNRLGANKQVALPPSPAFNPLPSSANCSELWYEQPLDHSDYNAGAPTWRQRYFLCDSLLNTSNPQAPIFFYTGNEGNVETYVNNTGFAWELAQEMGALLVFGEHRYYGKSKPPNVTSTADMRYLSIEQTLMDFVKLIQAVKDDYNLTKSPVVAFGGSYGGMLSAWMRMKYPNVVYAALAASAPLKCNLLDQGWDPTSFWEVVTRTASLAGGSHESSNDTSDDSSPDCVNRTRAAFAAMWEQSATPEGQAVVSQALNLCEGAIENEEDVAMVGISLLIAFDYAAMASVPFPSSYFTGDPNFPFPPYPMNNVCEEMTAGGDSPSELLSALGSAVNFINNVTGSIQECYTREDIYDIAMQTGPLSPYSYQTCNQYVPNESFFPTTGTSDMFWDQGPFNASHLDAFCEATFGEDAPTPDLTLVPLMFSSGDLSAASNIILSNGRLDPWSSGGYLEDISETVVAILIDNVGHHVDLMFTNEADPPQLTEARAQEKALLRKWLEQYEGRACSSC